MTISEKVNKDYTAAIKARDREKVSALRLVKAEFAKLEKENKEPTDSQYIAILGKMVRQRLETAETYKTAGRVDLQGKEVHEATVIAEYIPKQLTYDEVLLLVTQTAAALNLDFQKANMGRLVKESVANAKGKTDGKTVSTVVNELIAITVAMKPDA